MADVFTKKERSRVMSKVRSKDTRPEMAVRRLVHSSGYRYRLHRKDLPGKPDLVFPRHEKVIFVHGCFWHGHRGCPRAARPTSNMDFWNEKLDKNMERDRRNKQKLRRQGWEVLVIWECETKRYKHMVAKIDEFLEE